MIIFLTLIPLTLQVLTIHQTIILHPTNLAITLPLDELRMVYGPSLQKITPNMLNKEAKILNIKSKFREYMRDIKFQHYEKSSLDNWKMEEKINHNGEFKIQQNFVNMSQNIIEFDTFLQDGEILHERLHTYVNFLRESYFTDFILVIFQVQDERLSNMKDKNDLIYMEDGLFKIQSSKQMVVFAAQTKQINLTMFQEHIKDLSEINLTLDLLQFRKCLQNYTQLTTKAIMERYLITNLSNTDQLQDSMIKAGNFEGHSQISKLVQLSNKTLEIAQLWASSGFIDQATQYLLNNYETFIFVLSEINVQTNQSEQSFWNRFCLTIVSLIIVVTYITKLLLRSKELQQLEKKWI